MTELTIRPHTVEKGTLFCHFSFRRPKGCDYGYFSVALYRDKEAYILIDKGVRKLPLWQDSQLVAAAQSYENALYFIHKWQVKLRRLGVKNILLVTNNSTLAKWIMNPNKNKKYYKYMDKAVEKYRAGSSMEISIGIGLCEPVEREKSRKFCSEEYVLEDWTIVNNTEEKKKGTKISVGSNYTTIYNVV